MSGVIDAVNACMRAAVVSDSAIPLVRLLYCVVACVIATSTNNRLF